MKNKLKILTGAFAAVALFCICSMALASDGIIYQNDNYMRKSRDVPLEDGIKNSNRFTTDEIDSLIKEKFKISRNKYTRRIVCNGNLFDDLVANDIRRYLLQQGIDLGRDKLNLFVNGNFLEESDPLMDFLDKQPSNVTGNLRNLANSLRTSTGRGVWDDYVYDVLKKHLVASFRMTYDRIPNEFCPVLAGLPYLGKTNFITRLFHKELKNFFFMGSIQESKDFEMSLCDNIWFLDDEFQGYAKSKIEYFKRVMSSDHFYLRKNYDVYHQKLYRNASFFGCTNNLKFIKDSNNRRVFPILLDETVDFELYNSIDKGHLLKEAYELYEAGYNPDLTKEELEKLKIISREFQSTTLEFDLLEQRFDKPKDENGEWIPYSELYRRLSLLTTRELNRNRLIEATSELGFTMKYATYKGGGKVKCYHVLNREAEDLYKL